MNTLSLFDELFNQDYPYFYTSNDYAPRADFLRNKDSYQVVMDLPGLTQDDINIELNDRVLEISTKEKSEKKEEKLNERKEFLLHERRHYAFERKFTLPRDIDMDNVKADFKNGVLKVTVAKKALSEPRKIAINVA